MATLTATAKGELTLDRAMMQRLGIEPGQQVSANFLPNGRLEIAASRQTPSERTAPAVTLRGVLKRPGQPVGTLEDMEEAIAAGWAGKPG